MGDVHGLLLVSDFNQEDTAWDDVETSAAVGVLRGVSLSFSIPFLNYDNSILDQRTSSCISSPREEFEGRAPSRERFFCFCSTYARQMVSCEMFTLQPDTFYAELSLTRELPALFLFIRERMWIVILCDYSFSS